MNDYKVFEEVDEVISGGPSELKEEKKVVHDKKSNQFSIKIPKNLALKSKLKENTIFSIVFNPKEEDTINQINQSKLVIYLKEGDESEGEKNS